METTKELSSVKKQYIAGFADGDSSIQLIPATVRNKNPTPYVEFYQSYNRKEPPELRYLQKHLSGNISQQREARGKQRRTWVLCVKSIADARTVLDIVDQYGIIKKPQAEIAISYLHNDRIDNENAVTSIRKAKETHSTVFIDPLRITSSYIAGLFTAEGYVGMVKTQGYFSLRAFIRQSSCPPLLHAICQKLGYGRVHDGKLEFSAAQAYAFLQEIVPYMKKSQKRKQAKLGVNWYKESIPGQKKRRDDEWFRKTEKTAEKLKKLKKR